MDFVSKHIAGTSRNVLTGALVVAPHTLWSWMGNKVILEKKKRKRKKRGKKAYVHCWGVALKSNSMPSGS